MHQNRLQQRSNQQSLQQYHHYQYLNQILTNYTEKDFEQEIIQLLTDALIVGFQYGRTQFTQGEQGSDDLNQVIFLLGIANIQKLNKIAAICEFLEDQNKNFQELLCNMLQEDAHNYNYSQQQTISQFYQLVTDYIEKHQNINSTIDDYIDEMEDMFIIGVDFSRNQQIINTNAIETIEYLEKTTQLLIYVNHLGVTLDQENFSKSSMIKEYIEIPSILLKLFIEEKIEDINLELELDQNIQIKTPISVRKQVKIEVQECKICCSDIISQEGIHISPCSHYFHKLCVKEYVNQKVKDKEWPIKCPDQCQTELTVKEYQLIFDKDQFKILQNFMNQKLFDSDSQYSSCPTSNCQNKFIFEGGDNYEFFCPSCLNTYCLNCRIVYHFNMTCQQFRNSIAEERKRKEEYQEDQFKQFVTGQNFKQCPQCMVWVERISGCLHMTCRCQFEFCYRCGGKYGRCPCGG